MSLLGDIFLIVIAIVFWIGVSEYMTGAPTTIISYYFAEFDGTTTGRIIKSKKLSGRWGGESYDIVYAYDVGNRYYMSDQINFLTNTTSVARKTVQQYPVDEEVTVYYDKSNPRFAVLERSLLGLGVWGQLIAGALMGLITLTVLPIKIFERVKRKTF